MSATLFLISLKARAVREKKTKYNLALCINTKRAAELVTDPFGLNSGLKE